MAIFELTPRVRLLFTDTDMSGSMDGLKLAMAVRDRCPPICIIATSHNKFVEITDLPDGSMFFSKPYSHGDLMDPMRELLAV
ncbi:hypothetical protein [Sinorhizobium sp. RAC02]|uniref:hypothetical protein n=1 Tax=Sinorhizobium sp. RAC02 TaxID=1842534 RepID=UPI002570BED6|nr:hypothetical protein [Sinorhizobium sp. RAC02]